MKTWWPMIHIFRVVISTIHCYSTSAISLWLTLIFDIEICIRSWLSSSMGDISKDSLGIDREGKYRCTFLEFSEHWRCRFSWSVLFHAGICSRVLFVFLHLIKSLASMAKYFNRLLTLHTSWIIELTILIIWSTQSNYCLPLSLSESLWKVFVVRGLLTMEIVRCLAYWYILINQEALGFGEGV